MARKVKENTIRTIWKQGGAVINGWLGIPSSISAENMAQANWDSLTVDLQHGVVDYQTAVQMMQAICTTPTIPIATDQRFRMNANSSFSQTNQLSGHLKLNVD